MFLLVFVFHSILYLCGDLRRQTMWFLLFGLLRVIYIVYGYHLFINIQDANFLRNLFHGCKSVFSLLYRFSHRRFEVLRFFVAFGIEFVQIFLDRVRSLGTFE